MKLVMANFDNLHCYLISCLSSKDDEVPINFRRVRSYVSSPRLFDVFVRVGEVYGLVEAGDTFLDRRTMLADRRQKTYTLSYGDWCLNKQNFELVEDFNALDSSVIKIQIWPYEAGQLDEFQMIVAVAMSYTRAELDSESRISSAINGLVEEYGFFADEF